MTGRFDGAGGVGLPGLEQARGEPFDARTDVWAFGSILFEMLTGRSSPPPRARVSQASNYWLR